MFVNIHVINKTVNLLGTLWSKVTELGSQLSAESSLVVIPTLLGERHVPQQNASVLNIDPGNLSLSKMFKAICKGIITNLHRYTSHHSAFTF